MKNIPKSVLARTVNPLEEFCLPENLNNECAKQSLPLCHQQMAFSRLSSKNHVDSISSISWKIANILEKTEGTATTEIRQVIEATPGTVKAKDAHNSPSKYHSSEYIQEEFPIKDR